MTYEPWEKLRVLAEEFHEGELRNPSLRFSVGFLRGGEIKQQFYCEQRLHYRYLRGEVDLELREGIARRIVSMVLGVSRKPVGSGWVRVPLIGLLDDVPVISTPDALLVDGDRVLIVVKAATTSSPSPRIYSGDVALVHLYMLLLRELGFKLGNTKYYIVKGDSKNIFKALLELRSNGKITSRDLAVRVLAHDEESAWTTTSWALAYWKNLRPPTPRPSPTKCSSCPYRDICPYKVG